MEEKNTISVIINIHDGNIQILPNATQAVQNVYGWRTGEEDARPGSSAHHGPSPEAARLSVYINKEEDLEACLAQAASCTTAAELAQVIVGLVGRQPAVTPELVVKEKFISLFLPLAPNLRTGRSVDNLRARINDVLARRLRRRPQ